MPNSPEPSAKHIKDSLSCLLIGSEVIVLDVSSSTNDLAKHHFEQGANEGLIILADHQTGGRGRFGRSWFSEPGIGIYLSVLLKPALEPEQFAGLPLLAGLAAASAINEFTRFKATLKWPNDVLLNNKKLCGILCETCGDPTGKDNKECHPEKSEGSLILNRLRSLFGLFQTAPTPSKAPVLGAGGGVVIGIGVNVNHDPSQFPDELKSTATSLKMENGAPVDRTALILSLIHHLDREYQVYQNEGTEAITRKWSENSEMFGKPVTLTQGKTTVHGTALRLDASGNLVVRTSEGRELSFDAGEVTLK